VSTAGRNAAKARTRAILEGRPWTDGQVAEVTRAIILTEDSPELSLAKDDIVTLDAALRPTGIIRPLAEDDRARFAEVFTEAAKAAFREAGWLKRAPDCDGGPA
jgi:hypothetical protein